MENKAASPSQSDTPEFDFTITDDAAFINALTPDANQTFKEYAAQKFKPRIAKRLSNVLRIDVVFDVYLENSLKNSARLHHGEGSGKRVKDNYKVPTNWKTFLHHSENRSELFSFLEKFGHEYLKPVNKIKAVTSCSTHKIDQQETDIVVFTLGSEVLCSPEQDTSGLESCNHEEVYTRIFLYMQDGMERRGLNCVVIHTVDTDVAVLGTVFQQSHKGML